MATKKTQTIEPEKLSKAIATKLHDTVVNAAMAGVNMQDTLVGIANQELKGVNDTTREAAWIAGALLACYPEDTGTAKVRRSEAKAIFQARKAWPKITSTAKNDCPTKVLNVARLALARKVVKAGVAAPTPAMVKEVTAKKGATRSGAHGKPEDQIEGALAKLEKDGYGSTKKDGKTLVAIAREAVKAVIADKPAKAEDKAAAMSDEDMRAILKDAGLAGHKLASAMRKIHRK